MAYINLYMLESNTVAFPILDVRTDDGGLVRVIEDTARRSIDFENIKQKLKGNELQLYHEFGDNTLKWKKILGQFNHNMRTSERVALLVTLPSYNNSKWTTIQLLSIVYLPLKFTEFRYI